MRRSLLVAALTLFTTTYLPAQRPVSLGIAGGASFPSGSFHDNADLGWHGLATIVISTLMQPLGLRLDVAYNQFSFRDTALGVDSEHQSTGSATLNFTYRLPMTNSGMSPYLISGLGAYRSDCSLAECDAITKYGWNVGLGTRFYLFGLRSFLEGRYHRTSRGEDNDVQYFPVTFGLLF
jgi:hypothetical protein